MSNERNECPAVARHADSSSPSTRRLRHARRAFTLPEILASIAIVAVIGAIAVPRSMRLMDRIVVHAAVDAIANACALARGAAVARDTLAIVTIDTARRAVRVTVAGLTLLDRPLDPGGPLTLSASRDRVVYSATGLGYGASNTTVIARRRLAADTLYTSRLGRVRH